MSFTDACLDLTMDGAGLAERLVDVAAELGIDELRVLVLVAERLRTGRQRYGTLQVATDRRCFPVEALEEAADGLVYAAVALMRQGDAQNGARRGDRQTGQGNLRTDAQGSVPHGKGAR